MAARSKTEVVDLLAKEVAIPHGHGTLLVVKDDDTLRESTVAFLSSVGYRVLSAGSAEEALAVANAVKAEIHLVISDVVMLCMSGPQLAERLTAAHPEMKVLFVSGYSESAARRKGVDDSATPFLQKPFPLRLLASKIQYELKLPRLGRAAAAAGSG